MLSFMINKKIIIEMMRLCFKFLENLSCLEFDLLMMVIISWFCGINSSFFDSVCKKCWLLEMSYILNNFYFFLNL